MKQLPYLTLPFFILLFYSQLLEPKTPFFTDTDEPGNETVFIQDSSQAVKEYFWQVNNLEQISGHEVVVYGNPTIKVFKGANNAEKSALGFDGVDDGIIVNFNPLVEATEFTIEVVFYPMDGGDGEQRFVHFQQDDDNRALIELRNFNPGEWYLDTFIKSGGTRNMPLIDKNKVHQTNGWSHAALIYQNGKMSHYVNGKKELESEAVYYKMTSGKVSLGMRMNFRSYYKGYIKDLKVTHKALDPSGFMVARNQ